MSFVAALAHTMRRRWLIGSLLVALPLLMGANDNFLREIEEDVKRQATTLSIDTGESAAAITTIEDTMDPTGERLPLGMEQAAFEKTFRGSSPGIYSFYQQLDPKAQEQVYQAYQNDPRISSISDRIVRLLTRKKP